MSWSWRPSRAPSVLERFGWELVNTATNLPLIAGIDIGEIASDGRLRSIVGFLDLVPGDAAV